MQQTERFIDIEIWYDANNGFHLKQLRANGLKLDEGWNIHMDNPLPVGADARIAFSLPSELDRQDVVGVRISGVSQDDAMKADPSLDTHGIPYGYTPFRVESRRENDLVRSLTLVDVHEPDEDFNRTWYFTVGVRDDREEHWLDPMIYNKGDGSGPGR